MNDATREPLLPALWVTLRPYLCFVSGAAALVGLAFARGAPAWRAVPTFAVLFLSYGFGQALTDCFQTDTDAISAPYRPLARGAVARAQVLAASLVGLLGGAAVLAALEPASLPLALAAVGGLAAYSPLKRTWWGGPPWNAGVVALLPPLALLAASGHVPGDPAFLAAVLAVFFAYADFVLTGYFKDLSADRQTGYLTLPVRFGWQPAAAVADLVALAALAAGAAGLALSPQGSPWAWAAWVAAAALSAHAHRGLHAARHEREAHRPIAGVVRAFLLLCAALALRQRPGWGLPLAAFLALFEVALRRRPEVTQI